MRTPDEQRLTAHLMCLAGGMTVGEIAKLGSMHHNQVKTFLYRARKRLGYKTNTQMVAVAIRKGIIK